jgi:hypothetical protein
MAPLNFGGSVTAPSYKPLLEDYHDASNINTKN